MIEFIKAMPELRKKVFFKLEDLLELNISEDVISELIKEWILRKMDCWIFTLSDNEVHLVSNVSLLLPKILFWEKTYVTGKWVLSNSLIIRDICIPLYCITEENIIENHYKFDNTGIYTKHRITQKPELQEFNFYISNWSIDENHNIQSVKIATLEQAIIDFFIFRKKIEIDFNEWLWFRSDMILKKVDLKKLKQMSLDTNNEKIINSVKNFLKWLKY